MNKLSFIGFTDRNNIGDYAIFLANKKLFGEDLRTRSDEQVLKPQESSPPKYDLFGGGTFFPYMLNKSKNYGRVIGLGLGVEEPQPNRYFSFGTRARLLKYNYFFLASEASDHNKSLVAII